MRASKSRRPSRYALSTRSTAGRTRCVSAPSLTGLLGHAWLVLVGHSRILARMSRATQPDSRSTGGLRMRARGFVTPFALALLVTLVNAIKPVVVDDTAYLAFARHIAQHPLDPYGFEVFWYSVPEPAMGILCPPVLPYWLALGIQLFGEHVAVLKLWLFLFAWLLAWSVRELLRRFARGTEGIALPLIVLSPAVLPMVNLMLDIPALALALAGLAVFLCACDRRNWGGAMLA